MSEQQYRVERPVPTVQVPVSLIEQFLGQHGQVTEAMVNEFRALLSQPTPTAEFRPAPDGWFTFGSHVGYEGPLEFSDETGEDGLPLWERHPTSPAAPPSIEDMAPGTTFTAEDRYGHTKRWRRGAHGPEVRWRDGWERAAWADIDPSTIRDVTPPTTTTKE